MDTLIPLAAIVARRLILRRQTLAVAESSSGGLIAASLLAQAGASAFFVGGGVVYTAAARSALAGLSPADITGMRSASPPYAALLAETMRRRMRADWGLCETGAAGPTGNSYGDAAGHSCLAVAGPVTGARVIETGHGDRVANMRAFAAAALTLLAGCLDEGLGEPLDEPLDGRLSERLNEGLNEGLDEDRGERRGES